MDRSQLSKPLEVGVVIVTHNSEKSLAKTLASLVSQIPAPSQVIVVDSGSSSLEELKRLSKLFSFEMACMPNIGFAAGNNFGYQALESSCEYVLFLNPDLILPPGALAGSCAFLEANSDYAAASPLLLRYDFGEDLETDMIDSAGISMTWYGHFYDRFQGENLAQVKKRGIEAVEGLCGACMVVRNRALKGVLLYKNQVFDESFFCYKEDIDLSLRLQDKGGKLALLWDIVAYHGRGWQRKKMARELRLISAKNELKIHLMRGNIFGIVYSSIKWMAVFLCNI